MQTRDNQPRASVQNKWKKSRRSAALWAAVPLAGALASAQVSATTLTFDPNLSGTGSDGSGNWDATTPDWSNGTSDQTFTNDGTTSAVFGVGDNGTAGTVTLQTLISALGVTFNPAASGNYDIVTSAANPLTIGASGLTVNGGASPTITVPTGAALTITNGGGVSVNVTTAGYASSTTAGVTLTGGGSFVDTGATSNFSLSVGPSANPSPTPAGSEITTFDASGLNSFTYSNTSTTSEFDVGYQFRPVATLYLANTGASTNSITAGNVRVSDTGGANAGSGASFMYLGNGTNTINATAMEIGDGKGTGTLAFNTTGSGGTLTINGQTGSGSTAVIDIGVGGSGSGTNTGTVNLVGHSVNINATSIEIGARSSSTASAFSVGSLSFDTGSVNTTSVDMAHDSSSGASEGSTGTLTVNGTGTLTVNGAAGAMGGHASDFYLARASASESPVQTATGTLDIKGGTANIYSDIRTGNTSSGVATTAVVGGNVIVEGGTLNLEGNSLITAGTSTIALTTTSGTIENIDTMTSNGTALGVTMATAGNTLHIAGTNAWTGPTAVNAGTIAVAPATILGNTAINVGTTGGSPTTATFLAGAGSSAGTVSTGTASLTVNPGSTLSLADGTIGTFTVNQSSGVGLTLGSGGAGTILDFDLSSSGADSLIDTAAASVSGANTIDIATLGSSLTTGTPYTLISAASGLSGGTFDFSNGQQTETVAVGGANYTLTLTPSDTAEQLTVSAVPEPATLGIIGIAMSGLLVRRRRAPIAAVGGR